MSVLGAFMVGGLFGVAFVVFFDEVYRRIKRRCPTCMQELKFSIKD